MNTIKPAAIVLILALGIAGAATVAPAATALHAVDKVGQAAVLQTSDAGMPTITIVGKRLNAVGRRAVEG